MRKYSLKKFLIAFFAIIAVLAGIQGLFHFQIPPFPIVDDPQPQLLAETDIVDSLDEEEQQQDEPVVEPDTPVTDTEDPVAESNPLLAVHPQTDSLHVEQPRRNIRRGTRLVSYHDCFPDIQDLQLAAAQHNGIRPKETREEIQKLVAQHKLVDITTSPFYVVDHLNHSMPYLVPKAQQLLNTIAVNFLDSLSSKGMKPYLPVVSSVLRSTSDVKRLQRGNGNATTNSCHSYGTTIDIAYHRFMPVVPEYPEEGLELSRWNDDLKFILGEVLYDLRRQGKCYVKYEYKQACFHLTVR